MDFAAHHPAATRPARRRRTAARLPTGGGALRELWLYLAGSERSRIRQRERLGELDDRLLRDIGLDPRGPKWNHP